MAEIFRRWLTLQACETVCAIIGLGIARRNLQLK
jgi:hypothetical protein